MVQAFRLEKRSNPRPTRRPGATYARPSLQRHLIRVPILARPGGRAQLVYHPLMEDGDWFQSSPDPEAGRNGEARRREKRHKRSNPRPTRRPGATCKTCLRREHVRQFQSSPDPEAGRNFHSDTRVTVSSLFQSSPDPEAGRNLFAEQKRHRADQRSNPRPTRRPGATGVAARGNDDPAVPILARPGGRAQLCQVRREDYRSRGSNPRPTRRPGATSGSLMR